jgi:DNA helicase-2/ATP-dependent DNA helicase PcrA
VRFVTALDDIKEARTRMGLAEWCRYLVDTVQLKDAWREDDPVIATTREENVDELFAAMAEYEQTEDAPSLSGFLENAALVTDIDTYQSQQDAVTLMTIHAAKGLEFPVVFITGLEEGLFPLSRSMEKPETLEEERRLFYVAATRAKERLTLTYARTRRRFGSMISIKSRFIEEIPRDHLDIENLIPDIELDGTGLGYNAPGRSWRTGFMQTQKQGRTVARIGSTVAVPRTGIAEALQAGSIIRHPQFGEGEILSIHGSGDGTTCQISFRAGFTKTIMVRYAPLELLRP